jgi:hypothetical protein
MPRNTFFVFLLFVLFIRPAHFYPRNDDYFKPLMSWLEEQNKGRQRMGVGGPRCPQRDVISAIDWGATGSASPALSLSRLP